MKTESLEHSGENRQNTKERRKLLDKLVGYGEMLQKLAADDKELRMEIDRLDHRLKDSRRDERFQQESRRRLSLTRVELLAYRKKLAAELSRTRDQISQTKKRLG